MRYIGSICLDSSSFFFAAFDIVLHVNNTPSADPGEDKTPREREVSGWEDQQIWQESLGEKDEAKNHRFSVEMFRTSFSIIFQFVSIWS